METFQERLVEDAKPKEPTIREVKEWLRVYFTLRRPVVVNCGHKIDNESIPKRNCPECWLAWFNAHGELVQTVEQAYQEHGVDFITNQHGTKFVRNFLKFMAAVAEFTSKMTEINGNRDKGTIGQKTKVQGTGSSQENPQQAA